MPRPPQPEPMSKHCLTRLQVELGRDMSLLGELRFIEIGDAILKIGARVLPVGVKKERIQAPIKVIVPSDVFAGTSTSVVRGRPTDNTAEAACAVSPPRSSGAADIGTEKRQEIEDGANLDVIATVRILLAELDLGIEEHRALSRLRLEPHTHRNAAFRRQSKTLRRRSQ